jgi:hypothetical protein
MRSLSESTIRLSRRAVARAHPELSEEEALLLWVELNYGADLAAGVRERLARDRP